MPTSTTKEAARQKIADLVARYNSNPAVKTANEAQLRTDFLDPFWAALGWDLENAANLLPFMREVAQEPPVEIEEGDALFTKRPDYSFRSGGQDKFFVEAKKAAVPVETNKDAAFQTRRYGWNAGLAVSVLTNFNKLAVYDCRYRPDANEEAHVARLTLMDHNEYVARFDELYDTFSREAVLAGSLESKYPGDSSVQGAQSFDAYFLEQIDRWRLRLAQNLVEQNPDISLDDVNLLVQRLLNRIIFLRFCEDRELETYQTVQHINNYQELVALFEKADRKYNSGLFDLLADQLAKDIQLSDDVLTNIFQELYYPTSPYAFTVIDAGMLGQIYEHFIAREVAIQDNQIELIEKPAYVEASGAVTTPQYVVDHVVARTVRARCEGHSPDDLATFTVADICCGSGVFLLSAFATLLEYYLSWYSYNDPEHWAREGRLYASDTGEWKLTLAEKHRILVTHVFGVDIDAQAVEATQFSLLLKIIEGETAASIQHYLNTTGRAALPKLNANIQTGNSLVDSTYFTFHPSALSQATLFAKLNPFDWESAFPQIHSNGGFTVIIGNPPYIRIQNMVGYSLEEYNYLRSNHSPYSSSKSANFDKYQVFVERGFQLLAPDGELEFIIPNRFLNLKDADTFRSKLVDTSSVASIVHFGTQQIFTQTTYTCILSLKKDKQSDFTVEFVNDLPAWRKGVAGRIESFKNADFDEKPWLLIHPDAQTIFNLIKSGRTKKLKEVADVFVGLQTSKDEIYIVKPISESPDTITFFDRLGTKRTIEKSIVRPCLLDVTLEAFEIPQANTYMIYPYHDGTSILYTPEEMRKNYPLCWEYLEAHRTTLESRSFQSSTPETWYRFGRSQSLTKFGKEEKLIWPILSLQPRYVRDDAGILITGGGNGPYYALRSRGTYDIRFLQAVLSHPVIEGMVRARAVKFRGGYYSHKKDAMQDLPIPALDMGNPGDRAKHDHIVQLVQQLEGAVAAEQTAKTPSKRQLATRQRQALRHALTGAVSTLYGVTPAEISLVDKVVE